MQRPKVYMFMIKRVLSRDEEQLFWTPNRGKVHLTLTGSRAEGKTGRSPTDPGNKRRILVVRAVAVNHVCQAHMRVSDSTF